MTQSLRILITNLFVARNSGSETVVELLADGFRRAGHVPVVLAPVLGAQAERMRLRGHILVDRVAAVPARPDAILALERPVALSAFAAFPDVAAVFACHSALFEVAAPRLHPQIRQWIAVDDLCRDRCLSRGVPADRLTVILNAVDFRRFVRRPPLPDRPARALLLTKNHGHQAMVRAACASRGIALDELGPAAGRVSATIEHDLLAYDLVFATARMALEAAAVGCSVVVCDARGFAGMLTSERLAKWRRLNFGAGLLAAPVTPEAVLSAIDAYDASDASRVADVLRREASIGDAVDQHLAILVRAMADPVPADPMATATWIEDLIPAAPDRDWTKLAAELFDVVAEERAAPLLAMEARQNGEAEEQRMEVRTALAQLDRRQTLTAEAIAALTVAVGELRAGIDAPGFPRWVWRRLYRMWNR